MYFKRNDCLNNFQDKYNVGVIGILSLELFHFNHLTIRRVDHVPCRVMVGLTPT
jgi:hypothetical protein